MLECTIVGLFVTPLLDIRTQISVESATRLSECG